MSLVTILMLRKRIIIDKLKKFEAFSEEKAVTPEEVGILDTDSFLGLIQNLEKRHIVKRTSNGKIYLVK